MLKRLNSMAAMLLILMMLSVCCGVSAESLERLPKAVQKTGSQLVMNWETGSWSWQSGDKHTADLTLTNETDTAVTELVLTLQPVQLNGSDSGLPVFTAKNGKKLKPKEQTETVSIDELLPGESVTLSILWKPETSLITADEASVTVNAVCTQDERTAYRSQTMHVTRRLPGTGLPMPKAAGVIIAALAVLNVLIFAIIAKRRKKMA